LMKPVKQSDLFDAMALALKLTSPPEVAAAAASFDLVALRPLRVLLAEDSLVNQKLAVALLSAHGHEVTIAGNGREAVAAAAHDRFDVILMDVQMPEMDGMESAAAIRARERLQGGHVPIIAMTAHALKGDRELCLESGMDAYVPKPIQAEQLFATIASLCAAADASPAPAGLDGELVNWEAALRSVQGNAQTLQTMVEAALAEIPSLMMAIHRAVDEGDADALRRAVHTLKGSIRYFGGGAAYAEICQLEQIGQEARLRDAAPMLDALEGHIEEVVRALREHDATAAPA
jgi:two-component system, sensor histidine kinase and response regulator